MYVFVLLLIKKRGHDTDDNHRSERRNVIFFYTRSK